VSAGAANAHGIRSIQPPRIEASRRRSLVLPTAFCRSRG
jgi:hypothetical protein